MRKKQGSKKKWIVIVCIAIILFAVAGSVLWLKFKEKSEELQKVTSISVTANDTYPAGENMGKITVTAEGLDAAGNHVVQQLAADQYVVTPERIPEHGHDFEVTVTLREDEEVQAKTTALIERQEVQRYEIGRKDPEAVQAILYENGDLEITGSGIVKNYRENEMPWKEDGVLYLSWIDPAAEIESMDYWFSGNSEFVAMLCSVPDTVRSMVRTFYGCTSMESVPDMTTAVYLEDITACYSGSAVRNGGELPGNLRTAEEAYRNCTALIHAADASACVQLTNMKNCYNGCIALSDTSTPDSVTDLEGAYQN